MAKQLRKLRRFDRRLGLERQEAIAEGGEVFRVTVEAQAHFALYHPLEAPLGTPHWGQLSGSLLKEQSKDPFARPSVGDYVVGRSVPTGWQIEQVLTRRTQFVRRAPRKRQAQLVAANVDWVLIVTSPNADFSARRLERYLATVYASGAQPMIVINKADLVEDVRPWLSQAQELAPRAPIIATSAPKGQGLDELRAYLQPNERSITAALVGSSGVGKSSLTNLLLGYERQLVQAIRDADDKGRHTTTHRELFALSEPSTDLEAPTTFVIDTPGMRAFGLWIGQEGLDRAFAEIVELAEQCRFRNCTHRTEPGCAVRHHIETGQLAQARLDSYRSLRAEVES